VALTPQQQQSVQNSGGYYDPTGNWIDMSGQNVSGGGANPVLSAIASLGGLLAGRAYGNSQASANIPPQLSQLLDMSVQRAQTQNPLFSAATSGMYQMLPDFAKGGPQIPNVPAGGSASNGSGGGTATGLGLSALALAALAKSGAFGPAVSALRNIFGGGAGTGTVANGSGFNFGVGGGSGYNPNGINLDQFSFYNPSVVQNPANPNAAAFGGAPIGGPDQDTAAAGTFGGPPAKAKAY
jgi:hypothetical protein